MVLRISGKQIDIGEAFRTRIKDRIEEVTAKYLHGDYHGHVTLSKSKNRVTADCVLHLHTGAILQTTGQALDPQEAFDSAADRIQTRLRRYNRRQKSRSDVQSESVTFAEYAYHIIERMPDEDDDDELPEDYAPLIVAETTMQLRRLSVADAVVELDLMDNPVLIFRNAKSDNLNMVYYRADGNIGWIDPTNVAITNKAATG